MYYARHDIPKTCTRFEKKRKTKKHTYCLVHTPASLVHTLLWGYCIFETQQILDTDANVQTWLEASPPVLHAAGYRWAVGVFMAHSLHTHSLTRTHTHLCQSQSKSNARNTLLTLEHKTHRRDLKAGFRRTKKHRGSRVNTLGAFILTVIRSMATGSTPTGRGHKSIHISHYEGCLRGIWRVNIHAFT